MGYAVAIKNKKRNLQESLHSHMLEKEEATCLNQILRQSNVIHPFH